jgi:hypothetical protein
MQPGSFLLTSRLIGQPQRSQPFRLGAFGFALRFFLFGHGLSALGRALFLFEHGFGQFLFLGVVGQRSTP